MTSPKARSSYSIHRAGVLLPLCVMVIATSCNYFKREEKHLPPEKMRALLLDINIAESYSTMVKDSTRKIGSKSTDSLAAYYKTIFEHHHITKGAFDTSLAWYKQHPAEFDSVLASAVKIAMRWRDSAAKKK